MYYLLNNSSPTPVFLMHYYYWSSTVPPSSLSVLRVTGNRSCCCPGHRIPCTQADSSRDSQLARFTGSLYSQALVGGLELLLARTSSCDFIHPCQGRTSKQPRHGAGDAEPGNRELGSARGWFSSPPHRHSDTTTYFLAA